MSNIAGVDVAVAVDDTYVRAQEEATFEANIDVLELLKKEADKFGEMLQGEVDWSISGASIYQESDQDNAIGADGVVSLEIGGDTARGVNSLEATFSHEFTERGGLDDPNFVFRSISAKEMEISLSGDYKEPSSSEGAFLDTINGFLDNSDTDEVPFTLTFGQLEFSGSVRPSDVTYSAEERGNDVSYDITLMHDGVITLDTGASDLDSGQEDILTAWFDEVQLDTLFFEAGDLTTASPDAGTTFYQGNTLVETITLTAERSEDLGLEFDLASDGALTIEEENA